MRTKQVYDEKNNKKIGSTFRTTSNNRINERRELEVVRRVVEIDPLQEHVDLLEGRSFRLVLSPALPHQVVQLLWAVVWVAQQGLENRQMVRMISIESPDVHSGSVI